MRLLTIAWTLVVVVTWCCCDSAYVPYPSLVRNADWYDSEIQDVELLDVSTARSCRCMIYSSAFPAAKALAYQRSN